MKSVLAVIMHLTLPASCATYLCSWCMSLIPGCPIVQRHADVDDAHCFVIVCPAIGFHHASLHANWCKSWCKLVCHVPLQLMHGSGTRWRRNVGSYWCWWCTRCRSLSRPQTLLCSWWRCPACQCQTLHKQQNTASASRWKVTMSVSISNTAPKAKHWFSLLGGLKIGHSEPWQTLHKQQHVSIDLVLLETSRSRFACSEGTKQVHVKHCISSTLPQLHLSFLMLLCSLWRCPVRHWETLHQNRQPQIHPWH